jgi:hypothetical protein
MLACDVDDIHDVGTAHVELVRLALYVGWCETWKVWETWVACSSECMCVTTGNSHSIYIRHRYHSIQQGLASHVVHICQCVVAGIIMHHTRIKIGCVKMACGGVRLVVLALIDFIC